VTKSYATIALLLAATACNRPQKSCTFDNNGHHFCIEWRGYTAQELSSMVCGGKIEEGRACDRKGAIGYCIVKDEKGHENHDFSYDQAHGPSSCPSPYVWVPLTP